MLADLVTEKKFKADQVIIKEGATVEAALYLVRSGEIKVSSSDRQYNETIKSGAYCGQDQLAADVGKKKLTLGDPSTTTAKYTMKCVGDVTCGVLTLADCRTVFDTTHFGKGKAKEEFPIDKDVQLKDLKRHRVLGTGTFGQVWLVSYQKHPYALKVQSKYELVQESQAKGVVNEKNIMAKMQHPFILKLVKAFQDDNFVYMLLSLIQGGELFSVLHTSKRDGVPEKSAKFYAAGISEALSYMHRRNIIYRDLKPENVLVDSDGYCVVVDFGFAK